MYKIAVIPGDGIGTEVINSGVEVLKALSKSVQNLPIEFHQFDWGAEYYKKHGIMMPHEGVEEPRDWMFEVSGYYPSFFSFWKKCKKQLKY